MMRRPVDGIVMVPYHLTDEEIGMLIDRTGVHVVALASHLSHPEVDFVYSDDGGASRDTVRWLIETKGHRRIGFIGVPESYPPGQRRRRGYLSAMQEAGLPVLPGSEQIGDFSVESGYAAMRALLALPEPPTAVFVCNDLMAIGAILMAREQGVRVPEDVAVVGFDNIPETTYITPSLTTIAQFPAQFGARLAEALFERLEGKVTGIGRRFEIPLQRIERDST
jgi:DNA-binding LacI/PurR family transcriptional regulator